jgi:formamidopyrimidine-DNA glycosylase
VPELPEVENARQLIASYALGRQIDEVNDTDTYVTRPHTPGELRAALIGRRLTAVHRRGKTMWCETSGIGRSRTPGPDLGLHLGMSGRIIIAAADGSTVEGGDWPGPRPQPPKPQWERFALEFTDGGRLALSDMRRFGRVFLNPDVGALGPDALAVTGAQFRDLITKGTAPVKARLLDQSKIAGVGNLLADEALWQAKVPPAARADSLTRAQADRLYRALESVLRAAIEEGGAHTGAMIAFRHEGAACPRCGAPMVHGTVGGRTTWWCSREQALPDGPAAGD